ncbi:hypothetical protein BCV70DRAFT_197101 [Testicularia cyperi]|uniref:Uncharacterized protein n=1 Tax=Testicularia cyperi TaxID=1882483 RepID=A0A317XX26_9BASI|nr:hypothetical protein BCV70DRAFT_197101 [Testicularia cyperi]
MAKGRSEGKVTTDPRFARVHTDPRFLKPKRDDAKVVVDDRFKGLFADAKGKKKTDRYGRKVGKGQSEADQMKRFYRLEDADLKSDDEDGDGSEDEAAPIDYARGEGDLESSSEEESSDYDDSDESESSEADSDTDEDVMIGSSTALQREKKKKASAFSRFDEDDEDDDDGLGSDVGDIDLDEELDESVYAQLDAQAQRAIADGGIEGEESSGDEAQASSSKSSKKGKEKEKPKRKSTKSASSKIPRGDDTHRLAVVNLDWDHVRAKDVYKVISSIVSPAASISAADALKAARKSSGKSAPAISQVRGKLLNVRVYPSDFGKERMAKEDLEGPPREIFKGARQGSDSDNDDEDDDEEAIAKNIVQVDDGGEFDEEALRKYQLDRLRYYYAVATFDSKETARHVYNEIDGTEMERTANVFDLRFVPDGMEFPDGEDGRDAEFRDEATEDAANYKGVDFKTDALRHSRVKLTWDQDDPERQKLTRMVSRGGLTKDQLRDDDFKAYLASDTESEDEDEQANAQGRDKLRALLNLGGGLADGGFGKKKKGGVFDDPTHDDDEEQGEMQITFLPGLSEAAAKKAKGQKKEGEDESTLEKYMRKQKEKKERRKAKRAGQEGDEEDGQADGNEALEDGAEPDQNGQDNLGFDDPFFNSEEMDMEAALAAEFGDSHPLAAQGKKESKKASKKAKKVGLGEAEPTVEEVARSRAELTDLIGDTNDELTADGRQHFDMKDILRVESGKDAKRAKLLKKLSKKKQRAEAEFQDRKGAPLVQDSFEIDAKDDRFSALMDDHRYAIDPSHPGFSKTKAMQRIMDERRKVLDSKNGDANAPATNGSKNRGASQSEDISSLVEKLKRRQGETNGSSASPAKKKKKTSA